MPRPRHHHSAWQVYSDVLMCVLMMFVMTLSVLLISATFTKAHKDDGIKPKAEYLVTLTWDDARDVDLDLWLQDPRGDLIYYRNREVPNIALDRDSRGFSTNKTMLSNGQEVLSGNQEIISIRTIMPGDYVAAVNYYSAGDNNAPIDCRVTVQKVNPVLALVDASDAPACHVGYGETINVVAFRVAEDGSVTVLHPPSVPITPQQ